MSRAPVFSDADKASARKWFKKGADCRERREYDYAIECYLTGLSFWPEAVEEGHMPLRSLAVQRQQTGGKKPSWLEQQKKSMGGKDPKQGLLNAEYLLAKDPTNPAYLDAMLKNANKAGLHQTLKWLAPLVWDSLRKDKKPDKGRFRAYRAALAEAAERATAQGDPATAVVLLEQAVASVDYLLLHGPDEYLRVEQRDLAGRLAIEKGKYEEAETFRDSLRDADAQKLLHDAERVQQGEQTYEALLTAARQEWQAEPTVPQKVYALVEVLLKREAKEQEAEAIGVLMQAHQQTRNYSFKLKADDIRLRQLERAARQLAAQASTSGTEEDQQQARLARLEQLQTEIEIGRERVANYPTDLRLKYRLGKALFRAGEFDEAIGMLQAAQNDPRHRYECQLLIGRCFLEKNNHDQAVAVLQELRDAGELSEELTREVMYWTGRALEAAGRTREAKDVYGKLLRQDYNYAQGDARRRMEALK